MLISDLYRNIQAQLPSISLSNLFLPTLAREGNGLVYYGGVGLQNIGNRLSSLFNRTPDIPESLQQKEVPINASIDDKLAILSRNAANNAAKAKYTPNMGYTSKFIPQEQKQVIPNLPKKEQQKVQEIVKDAYIPQSIVTTPVDMYRTKSNSVDLLAQQSMTNNGLVNAYLNDFDTRLNNVNTERERIMNQIAAMKASGLLGADYKA